MILSKLWFDLRWRFLFCSVLVALGVLLLIFLFPSIGPMLQWMHADLSAGDWAALNPLLSSYQLFMDQTWFHDVQYMVVFTVILALGGIMTEKKTHSILFSLSLPVSRRAWILHQAAFVFVLVVLLSCVSAAIVLIGGVINSDFYPLARAFQGAMFLALVSLPWIGVTLALTSLTQDKMRTVIVIIGIWFGIAFLKNLQDFRIWLPQQLLEYFMGATFPWQALIVIFAVGIGGLIFAIQRFEALDF